jgi:hypothetical protein
MKATFFDFCRVTKSRRNVRVGISDTPEKQGLLTFR